MLCALIYSILGTSGLDVQVLAMAREHCETLEMTLFSDCVGGSKAVVLTWILITHCVYSNCVTGQVSCKQKLDILECEVKWALGGITTNKDSGGDGIPVEIF